MNGMYIDEGGMNVSEINSECGEGEVIVVVDASKTEESGTGNTQNGDNEMAGSNGLNENDGREFVGDSEKPDATMKDVTALDTDVQEAILNQTDESTISQIDNTHNNAVPHLPLDKSNKMCDASSNLENQLGSSNINNASVGKELEAPRTENEKNTEKDVAEHPQSVTEYTTEGVESDSTLEKEDSTVWATIAATENSEETESADTATAETADSSLLDRLKSAETDRDQIQASYNALVNKLLSMKAFFGKMKETENELEQVRAALETANDERQAAIDIAGNMKREKAAAEKSAQEARLEQEKATTACNQLRSQVSDLNAECDRLSQSLTSTRRELVAQAEQLQDEKYTLENKCNALEKKGAADRKAAQAFDVSREEYKAEVAQLRLAVDELKTMNETLVAQNLESREKVKLLSQTLMAQHDSVAKQHEAHLQELERLNAQVELARAGEALLQQALVVKQTELDLATEQIASERAAASTAKADNSVKANTIGQLRHELVTVNEHLTKALTMLKKQGTSREVVDRQLISNVFISFLQLARGDAKKFQALELIAALLEWDNQQKVAAGLSHGQGQGNGSSTTDQHRRQSFISLWTEYLEKELSA